MTSAPLSVVKTTMVLSSWPICCSLSQDEADVVVHLLHAGFIYAPILAAGLSDHGHVLGRKHGGDVHASGVVPHEEGFIRFLRVVAIEEVDDVGEISSSTPFDLSRVSGPSS